MAQEVLYNIMKKYRGKPLTVKEVTKMCDIEENDVRRQLNQLVNYKFLKCIRPPLGSKDSKYRYCCV